MKTEYKTVLKYSECELEEKKSRFIASTFPVSSEKEAVSIIESFKKKYSDATHNVYAYNVGIESFVQRYSDDGEPSGTAGLPVMEAIKKADLKNILIVVTRYFGGTLLGASGLIRAYGKSARMGIQSSVIISKKLCKKLEMEFDYSFLGKIQSMVSEKGYEVKNKEFGSFVRYAIYVPLDDIKSFKSILKEITNAKIKLNESS